MGRHRSRSKSASPSGRDTQSSKWDGATGHRIHVADLAAGISRREVERAFAKYGPINEVWVASNPPCFAFINFTHRNDAEKAIREVDGKIIGSTRVGVSWARDRTYGSRSRGGRGAPYGSYQSRRRSRSRSRSNSRRQKRRHSRSRSRDRHRRRSGSPRDRKQSRRSSKEKNENDRRKSKTPQSPPSSRSGSVPRNALPKNSEKRGESINAEITDENNTHNRSPLPVDDE